MNDCKTGWVERSVNMSIDNCMSTVDAINCMRRRMDTLEKKVLLANEAVLAAKASTVLANEALLAAKASAADVSPHVDTGEEIQEEAEIDTESEVDEVDGKKVADVSSDSGASETERDEKEDADDERDGDETNSEEDVRKKNINIISSVINLLFEHWTTNRQLIAFLQARPKKRAKHEIQADIIKLLAPKFCEAMISPNKLDWSASKNKRKVGRSTLF